MMSFRHTKPLSAPVSRFLFLTIPIWVGSLLTHGNTESDAQWTFNNNSFIDYTLTEVSTTDVYDGALPVNDPTLNLTVGKRYGVTIVNFRVHPFSFIAKGSTAGEDVVLLALGSQTGSFEADPEVNWTDDGNGHVEFTVTEPLIAAASEAPRTPGYRCDPHASTMRGDFSMVPAANPRTPLDDPIPEPIPPSAVMIDFEVLIDGLTAPLGVEPWPDDSGRLVVYEQTGLIHIMDADGSNAEVLLDLRDRVYPINANYDERGLLGLAVYPQADPVRLYTYTSEPAEGQPDFLTASPDMTADHHSVIAEWTRDPQDPEATSFSIRREVLRIAQPQFNHNGGELRFGPDGMLFITLGDGGASDDQGEGHSPIGNGQDLNVIHGSVIRIDVDGANSANGQYGIPSDNPLVNADGLDEIWAWGFRNANRFSFDSVTGDLLIADVGQNDVEEIDILTTGGNYGWPIREGSFYFDANGPESGFVTNDPPSGAIPEMIDPVAQYDHDEGTAIVGGFRYHGSIQSLQGRYITGDFGTNFGSPSGRLFLADLSNGTLEELQIGSENRPLGLWLKGFGIDPAGEVYICGSTELGPSGNGGAVWKIVAPPPAVSPTPTPQPTPLPTPLNTPTPTPSPTPFADTDQDGRADSCESLDSEIILSSGVTHLLIPDSDGDGLLDGMEDGKECPYLTGAELDTDPILWDTDGDGWSDGLEVLRLMSDPMDPMSPDPALPAFEDMDGDGLPASLDPADDNDDTDGDGFADGYEAQMGNDPTDALSFPPLGDANADGASNNLDAILVFNWALGNVETPEGLGNADIYTNGFVNNQDAIILFNWTLGNVTTIPVRP